MRIGEAQLLVSAECLRAAVQRYEGIEARIRSGQLTEDLLRRSLAAAEEVLARRSAWYRLMQQAGWTPPTHVVEDLAVDEHLVDLSA